MIPVSVSRRMTCLAYLLLATPVAAQRPSQPRVLEAFDDASAFHAVPSDGVALTLRGDSGIAGRALRLDFDFQGHAGYAVARRAFVLKTLPEHWAATLWVRGDARPNTLELKLVDSSGLNVWWIRRPELQPGPGWTLLRFRSSDLNFAWGPLGGGPPRAIAALEIAVTAGQGGRGWLALDELTLIPTVAPVADSVRPRMQASSAARNRPSESALPVDFAVAPQGPRLYGDRAGWHSETGGDAWISLDFRGTRRLSGLVLDWPVDDWPTAYEIEGSDDGRSWTPLRHVRGRSGRQYVHLPRTELGHLRITMRRGARARGVGLYAVHVLSDSAASTRTSFLERVADGSPAGLYPRQLLHQQGYWTVLGLPRDDRDGLLSEDGAVESRPGGFSVEPFVLSPGRVRSWSDGQTTHSLDGGWRPIPTVRRVLPDLALAITAFAAGDPGASVLWIRYRLVNRTARGRDERLVIAVRPIQVNPPWQFLGVPGGAATIGQLATHGQSLVVNATDRIVVDTPNATFDAESFDAGGLRTLLDAGRPTPRGTALALIDSTGFAEGTIAWAMHLAANDSADAWIALPVPGTGVDAPSVSGAASPGDGALALDHTRALWDRELGGVRVDLPADGAAQAGTLRSALAYVMINARGPAIQPGTRSYRRSWIRDGALTSSALLRLGHADDVRAFLDWYAPNVFPDGKVPCCVDARGADPVAENDADGELLYLAAEYFRISGDSASVRRRWPTLARVAAHLDSLRRSRRTAPYRTPDSLLVFGLLPPSISHEGYSARPAYSYWDDWWGVRGLDDAALLARVAHDPDSTHLSLAAGEMRHDVVASVARAMERFGLRTLPGAADLGDTDPTSSTVALEPAQALHDLPRDAARATFDSAWATLERRVASPSSWDIFVPYEWRVVGALLRLDEPERARAYARWLMTMRRPLDWNEWSEAVWREPRTPKFIGDMPHGWVASDFMRATVDLIAYERERDSTLVVGAGIPIDWARHRDGVTVRGVNSWWGTLDLTVRPAGATAVRLTIAGVAPPGGIELRAPFGARPTVALVDGVPTALTSDGRAVRLRGPAVVEFRY